MILLLLRTFQSTERFIYFFFFLDVDERIRLSVRRTVYFCDRHWMKSCAALELVGQMSDRRTVRRTMMLTVDCDALGTLANATLSCDAGNGDDTFGSTDATSARSRRGWRNAGQRVQVNGRNFISLNQFFRRRFRSLENAGPEDRKSGPAPSQLSGTSHRTLIELWRNCQFRIGTNRHTNVASFATFRLRRWRRLFEGGGSRRCVQTVQDERRVDAVTTAVWSVAQWNTVLEAGGENQRRRAQRFRRRKSANRHRRRVQ